MVWNELSKNWSLKLYMLTSFFNSCRWDVECSVFSPHIVIWTLSMFFVYERNNCTKTKLRKNRSLKNVFVDRLFNSFHWGGWYHILISHIITWTNFMLWSVKEMIQFTHDFNVESFHHRFEVRDVWFGFQGDEVQDRFFPVYLTRYQLNYRVRNCDFSVR